MGNAQETPERADNRVEIYRLMVETWRWQIGSNWQRTDYFAAFQTALLLAAGKIILDWHFRAGIVTSIFGLALNIGWVLNDMKAGSYINYWWEAAKRAEAELHWKFITAYDKNARDWGVRREWPKYNYLMWYVRLLFTVAWIVALTSCVTALVLKCHR